MSNEIEFASGSQDYQYIMFGIVGVAALCVLSAIVPWIEFALSVLLLIGVAIVVLGFLGGWAYDEYRINEEVKLSHIENVSNEN